MSDNLFPLTGALLFAGLFAGLSAISSHCLIDEVERLTRERDDLLACRQGEQRCHECPDKLELPAIPDDAVVDLFGCLIDVTQPQCQACKDTGRITISVGGTAILSNVLSAEGRLGVVPEYIEPQEAEPWPHRFGG